MDPGSRDRIADLHDRALECALRSAARSWRTRAMEITRFWRMWSRCYGTSPMRRASLNTRGGRGRRPCANA